MADWTKIIIIGVILIAAVWFLLPMLTDAMKGMGGGGSIGGGAGLTGAGGGGGDIIIQPPSTTVNITNVMPAQEGQLSFVPSKTAGTSAFTGTGFSETNEWIRQQLIPTTATREAARKATTAEAIKESPFNKPMAGFRYSGGGQKSSDAGQQQTGILKPLGSVFQPAGQILNPPSKTTSYWTFK